ncbi:MAG: hypothetical protein IKA32_04315 [Lentisphaeria bacterium]|nr:hypothetical protein [Lentisphaeria bacterium]
MRHFLHDLRHRTEYCFALVIIFFLRCLPRKCMQGLARFAGNILWLIPSTGKIVLGNLKTVFPEMTESERIKIGKSSVFHSVHNVLEFFWIGGDPVRTHLCYAMPDELVARIKGHIDRNERLIFVNPHLGSWEASGTIAPYFGKVRMAAIAKPVKNPYLNRLLNARNREKVKGLEVIFSKGAVRAALSALRRGCSIGILIDQNTRVRDGGEFVDFFGVPVPCSTAPVTLKRYCDAHDIPVQIVFGSCPRLADGRCTAHMEYLSKPFDQYADDREVIAELMQKAEEDIRKYPDQYLWFYKRFQYIYPEASEEVKKRYPDYAVVPGAGFFSKTAKGKK